MNNLITREQFEQADISRHVCFAGPRPANLPDAVTAALPQKLRQAVRRYAAAGKTTFLNGCMSGFDILAGEAVLAVRQECPQIRCVTVAPFRVNFFNNRNWTPQWKQRALHVYETSDLALTLSETYHPRVYYERDEYMADHSSVLVCYYAGAGKGTKYTLDYAEKKRLAICNLYEQTASCEEAR